MIRVVRTPPPAHLASPNAVQWTNDLCDRRAAYYRKVAEAKRDPQISSPKRPPANRDHYAHPDVRDSLEIMFGPKCAYCEGEVTSVSPQHIEHYRPASRYPALAYQWENLLLACPHCNSTHKNDRFPVAPSGNTPRENRRFPCARTGEGENPLLINPCQDDPSVHLTFRDAYVVAQSERGRWTRRVCGLNRDGLVQNRRKHLQIVRLVIEYYRLADEAGNHAQRSRAANQLREMSSDYAPYAGMVRAELAAQNIAWDSL